MFHARDPQLAQWGQLRDFAPPWSEGEVRPLIDWHEQAGKLPRVHSAILGIKQSAGSLNQLFRWRIAAAIGGVRTIFLIDAVGTQQICVPCNALGVSLVSEKFNNASPYDPPDFSVTAFAGLAEGTTASRVPTLTQFFQQAGPGVVSHDVPQGAQGWRIVGNMAAGAGANPFLIATSYEIQPAEVKYDGPQLVPLAQGGDFLPLPGAARQLVVTFGGFIRYGIQWAIDLG
jgi:hypothetical protein